MMPYLLTTILSLSGFSLEHLILAPNPDPTPDPTGNFSLFCSGQIQLLYEASNAIISKTPEEQATKPVDVQCCTQLAADQNYPSSANACLTKALAKALIDESNLDVCHDLHSASLDLITKGLVRFLACHAP